MKSTFIFLATPLLLWLGAAQIANAQDRIMLKIEWPAAGDVAFPLYCGLSSLKVHAGSVADELKSDGPKIEYQGGLYANGATGIAKLRRDSFASMRGPGALTTEPVGFSGQHPFVNAKGSLRAEALAADGKPIPGLKLADCTSFTGDSTPARVTWKGDLAAQAGEPVRLRFHLTESDLYAFWISSGERASSGAYVAGGGPEFNEDRDTQNTRP